MSLDGGHVAHSPCIAAVKEARHSEFAAGACDRCGQLNLCEGVQVGLV